MVDNEGVGGESVTGTIAMCTSKRRDISIFFIIIVIITKSITNRGGVCVRVRVWCSIQALPQL